MVLESRMKNGIHGMLEFIDKTPVPESDLEFFKTVPHLKYYLEDPNYVPAPFYSVYTKPNEPTADLFFAKTIRSPETIPHCLMLLKKGLTDWPFPEGQPESTKTRPFPAPEVPDVTILYDLKSGMNGFADTAHGGSMCALLDETLGMCAEIYRQTRYKDQRTSLFTAQLNTSFLAPVQTPNVIRVKTWLVGAEGRKWRVRGQMDDGHGKPLLEVESLWISSREPESL